MSEHRHVTVLDASDDNQEVDTSELQPLDDATAGRTDTAGDDLDATVAVLVAEPPTNR